MNREDIIRMAREAGMPPVEIASDKPVLYPVPDAIERFAALVAAAEREECAKAADEAHELMNSSFQGLAAAIRARGQS